MAYIIAEPCIGTKDTACVDVCPVDCIHPAKGRTYDDGRPTYDEAPQLDGSAETCRQHLLAFLCGSMLRARVSPEKRRRR